MVIDGVHHFREPLQRRRSTTATVAKRIDAPDFRVRVAPQACRLRGGTFGPTSVTYELDHDYCGIEIRIGFSRPSFDMILASGDRFSLQGVWNDSMGSWTKCKPIGKSMEPSQMDSPLFKFKVAQ